jgi:hypothetical protein
MEYKVYVMDATGHISTPPLVIRCADDQEAIRQARQYLDGTAVEVWQDRKLVAKLAPEDG